MPAFRAAVTSTVASRSSLSLTFPATTQADDVALFFLEVDNNPAATAPAGWTLITPDTATSDGVGTHVWWHRAVAGDANASTGNFTFAANFSQGALAVWSSVFNTGDPQDVAAQASAVASGTSYVVPSITTAHANAMVVASSIETDVTQTAHALAAWNKRVDLSSISVFDLVFASAGATGTKTITVTGSAATAVTRAVALRDAIAGPLDAIDIVPDVSPHPSFGPF